MVAAVAVGMTEFKGIPRAMMEMSYSKDGGEPFFGTGTGEPEVTVTAMGLLSRAAKAYTEAGAFDPQSDEQFADAMASGTAVTVELEGHMSETKRWTVVSRDVHHGEVIYRLRPRRDEP
jgi:hypothetical protein